MKQPLVYTNVQIRNWTSFQKLGVRYIYSPGSYFCSTTLDFPVSLGEYKFPSSPEEPCILHLVRTPCSPGLPCKEQFKAGRFEQPFGRITIANSDSDGHAYTNIAIDQAYRAVQELASAAKSLPNS